MGGGGGYQGRAHIFHAWSSLVVTITCLLGCIVTLHRGGEGRGLYSPAGAGSTGSPAGCVVVYSEGVCGLQSSRAGEVGAGRSRGVEVRVGWLCWEHHCTRLQERGTSSECVPPFSQ